MSHVIYVNISLKRSKSIATSYILTFLFLMEGHEPSEAAVSCQMWISSHSRFYSIKSLKHIISRNRKTLRISSVLEVFQHSSIYGYHLLSRCSKEFKSMSTALHPVVDAISHFVFTIEDPQQTLFELLVDQHF